MRDELEERLGRKPTAAEMGGAREEARAASLQLRDALPQDAGLVRELEAEEARPRGVPRPL